MKNLIFNLIKYIYIANEIYRILEPHYLDLNVEKKIIWIQY